MTWNIPIVLFSDIDGILCDRRTGSFDHAGVVLDALERRDAALVLCSGKSRAEIERIHQILGISHPFIAEHGAAIFVPAGYFGEHLANARTVAGYEAIEFGSPYRDVVATLHRVAWRMRADVVGFSDMSVEEVAADGDLPLAHARLAKLRDYEEPFRVVNADSRTRHRLSSALRSANLGLVAGGRYDYAGARVDAGDGVQWLCARYRSAWGSILTIGLGATLSDLSMLRRVDIPLVIESEERRDTAQLVAALPEARLTRIGGSNGWPAIVRDIVDRSDQIAMRMFR